MGETMRGLRWDKVCGEIMVTQIGLRICIRMNTVISEDGYKKQALQQLLVRYQGR